MNKVMGRCLVMALMMLLWTVPARAEWQIRPEILTDVPVQVGAGVILEGPGRVRLGTSLGWLPSGYLKTTNALLVAWFEDDGYTSETAELVEDSLRDSLVWRLHAGWRPWERLGFFFHAGYGLAALGGDVSSVGLLEAVTGVTVPYGGIVGVDRDFDVSSVLHMFDVEVGWEWAFSRGLFVRTALGGAFTVGSSTEVDARFTPMPFANPAVRELERSGEDYLNDTYRTYVHTPYLTVALGYAF